MYYLAFHKICMLKKTTYLKGFLHHGSKIKKGR